MKKSSFLIVLIFGIAIIIVCGGCGPSAKVQPTPQGLVKTDPVLFINGFTDAGFKKTETIGATPEQKIVWLLSPNFDKIPFNLTVHYANTNTNEIDSIYCEYNTWNKESSTITAKYLHQAMQGIYPKKNEVFEVYQEIMLKIDEAAKQQKSKPEIKFKRGEINISAYFFLFGDVVKTTLQFDTLSGTGTALTPKEKLNTDMPPPLQSKEYFLPDTNKTNPGGKIKVYESQIPNYFKYINGRYAFSIDFPQDFSVGLEATNLSGAEFFPSNSQVKLTVSGSQNITKTSNNEEYSQALKGRDIGYSATGTDWHTISWKENGKIFYMKTFVSPQYLTGFIFEYPERQKNDYEQIVGNLDKTFNPGWNTSNKTGEKKLPSQPTLTDGRWQKVENFPTGQRLQIWNPSPTEGETVEYTGGKISAYELTGQESGFPVYFVHNFGVAKWYTNGKLTQTDEGTYYGGKRNGEFTQRFADGRVIKSYWENGVKKN